MLHARVIHPPAFGARLVSVDEASIAGIGGARVVRIQSFLAVVAEREWDAVRAARALKAQWSGGPACGSVEGVRGDAGGPGRARPGDRQAGRPGRADRAARGHAHAGRHLSLAHADPRLHRAVLRRGRRAGGPRHGLELVAERARLPGHVRAHARRRAGPGARHLHGRRGLLRGQRGRRRGRGGGAALEGGRPSGARAVEPAGGARARSQGPRPAPGAARGASTRTARSRRGRRRRGCPSPPPTSPTSRWCPSTRRASRRRRAAPPG